MVSDPHDMTRLVFHALSGLVLIAGATADLYLGVLVQTRRLVPGLRARPLLSRRPFSAFHAQLTLFATLAFALPVLFQAPAAGTPKDGALILGPLVYAFSGLLVVALCLAYARTPFRDAFLSPSCAAPEALKKGVFFGLAALPPVVALSWLISFATQALGFEPARQEVFEWLGDDALALGTRGFMLAAAVLIAPVVEELLFRGILLPALLRARSFLFAALLTGAYFALVHLHAPSFLPLLLLSAAFSAGYAATGSILTPMAMHAVFNLTSVLFYFADP